MTVGKQEDGSGGTKRFIMQWLCTTGDLGAVFILAQWLHVPKPSKFPSLLGFLQSTADNSNILHSNFMLISWCMTIKYSSNNFYVDINAM